MASSKHQFIEFDDQIIKRYTKTIPGLLTGYRLNPHRPENRLDWVLQTPESAFVLEPNEKGEMRLKRISFSYEDEVLEIYSETELKLFQRLNRAAIESGILVEYTEASPGIDTSNVFSNDEVVALASTKQLTAFRKKIAEITSVHLLDRVSTAIVELDRPISFSQIIQSRRNELTR